jgi:hypothetical protein
MTGRELRVGLERLRSLRYHVGGVGGVSVEVVQDFNAIMDSVSSTDPEFDRLKLSMNTSEQLRAGLSTLTGNREVFPRDLFSARVGQAIAVLEALAAGELAISDRNVPSLPFVEDDELRSRAVSLLDREEEHFDRVVNQATQVLEVRIRTIARYQGKETGPGLVSKVLNNDPTLALLRVSDDPAEQQGFANLCRGVMEFLRNSSHHTFKVTSRDDAAKVCVMVDYLLGVLAASKLHGQP